MMFVKLVQISPVFALFVYGGIVFQTNMTQNIATWFMWVMLDMILLYNSITSKSKTESLAMGYTVGATFVLFVLIFYTNNQWTFGKLEIFCLLAVLITLIVRQYKDELWAINLMGVAMFIAGVPYMVDLWNVLVLTGWWLWVTCFVAASTTLYESRHAGFWGKFFPLINSTANGVVALLCFRAII